MSKVVHNKKEPFDVYIGRPSRWGNPHTVRKLGREDAIRTYEQAVRNDPAFIQAMKDELTGKVLGCWCAPEGGLGPDDPLICHGQIILKAIRGDYDATP